MKSRPALDLLDYDYTGLSKVISGGQCGADRGGIEAAYKLGVETGGWAPRGWKTAEGSAPELAKFGLKEHASDDYQQRTKLNVSESDATLIVASNLDSAGSRLTLSTCMKKDKPFFIVNPTAWDKDLCLLKSWCLMNRIVTLNVAGNRDYSDRSNGTKHFDAAFNTVTWLLLRLDEERLLKRGHINTSS